MTRVPSTAVLASEGSKRGLFIKFPSQIKEDRAGRELCPSFYTLFICFYSSYCCKRHSEPSRWARALSEPSVVPGLGASLALPRSPVQHCSPQPFCPVAGLRPPSCCWEIPSRGSQQERHPMVHPTRFSYLERGCAHPVDLQLVSSRCPWDVHMGRLFPCHPHAPWKAVQGKAR